MEDGYYYNGADVVAIIGLILKPIFKSKPKDSSNAYDSYQYLTDKYSLSYLIRNLNIPKESASEFVYFVEDNGFNKDLLKEGNELQFLEFLIDKSIEFQKIKNEKN